MLAETGVIGSFEAVDPFVPGLIERAPTPKVDRAAVDLAAELARRLEIRSDVRRSGLHWCEAVLFLNSFEVSGYS